MRTGFGSLVLLSLVTSVVLIPPSTESAVLEEVFDWGSLEGARCCGSGVGLLVSPPWSNMLMRGRKISFLFDVVSFKRGSSRTRLRLRTVVISNEGSIGVFAKKRNRKHRLTSVSLHGNRGQVLARGEGRLFRAGCFWGQCRGSRALVLSEALACLRRDVERGHLLREERDQDDELVRVRAHVGSAVVEFEHVLERPPVLG